MVATTYTTWTVQENFLWLHDTCMCMCVRCSIGTCPPHPPTPVVCIYVHVVHRISLFTVDPGCVQHTCIYNVMCMFILILYVPFKRIRTALIKLNSHQSTMTPTI